MYNHVSEHCGLQRKTDYFPYNAFVRPFSCMSVGCNSIYRIFTVRQPSQRISRFYGIMIVPLIKCIENRTTEKLGLTTFQWTQLDTKLGLKTSSVINRYQFDDRRFSMEVIYSNSDQNYYYYGDKETQHGHYEVKGELRSI